MIFFDINVGLGPSDTAPGPHFETVESLQAELRRLRIGSALVYWMPARRDMRRGNQELLKAIAGHENLFPCWIIDFESLGGIAAIRGYVREAVGAGARALRLPLAPDGLTSWGGYLEELMRAASDGDIPLLLDLLEEPSPAHARDLLEAHGRHPLLHLVVLGVGSLYRLFVNDDRLYVEYHDTPFPDETLSDACLRRLVFGTGMPAAPGECAVEQTALSGLKPSEQHALAADNAYRLLSLCKPPAISPLYLEPQRRPPGLVVDIAAPDVILPHLYGPDEDLTSTQRPGVHKAILCPAAPAYRFAFEGSLAPVLPPAPTADEYEAHTGQLYQYVAIGPGLTVEDARALEPQFEESGAYAGLRLERGWAASPAAERMLDLAQERGLPVLMPEPGADDALPPESDEWGREAWARVAEGRPDLPSIVPGGSLWDGVAPEGERLFDFIRSMPNLHVCVSGRPAYRGTLVALVRMIGARRVLFGSDFKGLPGNGDLARRLGYVTLSPLSHMDKMNILGGNALRLFRCMA